MLPPELTLRETNQGKQLRMQFLTNTTPHNGQNPSHSYYQFANSYWRMDRWFGQPGKYREWTSVTHALCLLDKCLTLVNIIDHFVTGCPRRDQNQLARVHVALINWVTETNHTACHKNEANKLYNQNHNNNNNNKKDRWVLNKSCEQNTSFRFITKLMRNTIAAMKPNRTQPVMLVSLQSLLPSDTRHLHIQQKSNT